MTDPVPIPMYLTCPKCGARHIDEGEFATKVHHTHECQSCGLTWRPAVVPTVGVQFLFKSEAPAQAKTRVRTIVTDRPAPGLVCECEHREHAHAQRACGASPARHFALDGWPDSMVLCEACSAEDRASAGTKTKAPYEGTLPTCAKCGAELGLTTAEHVCPARPPNGRNARHCMCGHLWDSHNEHGCCFDEDCTCAAPRPADALHADEPDPAAAKPSGGGEYLKRLHSAVATGVADAFGAGHESGRASRDAELNGLRNLLKALRRSLGGMPPEDLPKVLPAGNRWHDGMRWRALPTEAALEPGRLGVYVWPEAEEKWEASVEDIDWQYWRSTQSEK